MKLSRPTVFYVVGLLAMAFAYYGHVANLNCESNVVWPTYIYLLGASIFGVGLYLYLNKTTKSLLKSGIYSFLFVLTILVAGAVLAIATQPDTIFHCYSL